MERGVSTVLVVAAALVRDDATVLMQRRPAGKQHGGLWEFPGGKLEPGEGAAAALARELAEELAITVDPGDCVPLGFAADNRLVLLLYGCRRWRGEPSASDGAAIAWIAPDRFADIAMPPLDVPLARHAAAYALAPRG